MNVLKPTDHWGSTVTIVFQDETSLLSPGFNFRNHQGPLTASGFQAKSTVSISFPVFNPEKRLSRISGMEWWNQ